MKKFFYFFYFVILYNFSRVLCLDFVYFVQFRTGRIFRNFCEVGGTFWENGVKNTKREAGLVFFTHEIKI